MQKKRQEKFLDNRLFPAFMAAAETENFTSAAKKAFMTQSGISQHIARLEKQVGLPLFKRVAKHVVLTDSGKRLKKYIEDHCNQTEAFLGALREAYNGISGSVSYAMPPSCLSLPQFSHLLDRCKAYPQISLDITLALDADVVERVLTDRVDFGLVMEISRHPNLRYRHFHQEELILAAASPQMLNGLNENSVRELKTIAYPGVEVYFNRWLRHYYSDCHNLSFLSLPISGRANSIEAAIKMVEGGLGVSLFPRHSIQQQLTDNRLFELESEQLQPLYNDIHLVALKNYAYPQAVRLVMSWFSSSPP
ncbi:MAG: LysR family transcriptional regulator [Chromatiales bacterium]|nr:LysR family transcriptional regulator [Chromatiales bacterium]